MNSWREVIQEFSDAFFSLFSFDRLKSQFVSIRMWLFFIITNIPADCYKDRIKRFIHCKYKIIYRFRVDPKNWFGLLRLHRVNIWTVFNRRQVVANINSRLLHELNLCVCFFLLFLHALWCSVFVCYFFEWDIKKKINVFIHNKSTILGYCCINIKSVKWSRKNAFFPAMNKSVSKQTISNLPDEQHTHTQNPLPLDDNK